MCCVYCVLRIDMSDLADLTDRPKYGGVSRSFRVGRVISMDDLRSLSRQQAMSARYVQGTRVTAINSSNIEVLMSARKSLIIHLENYKFNQRFDLMLTECGIVDCKQLSPLGKYLLSIAIFSEVHIDSIII